MNGQNKGVILTIDDETVVRESIAAFLEDYDYTVLEAADGRDGLEILAQKQIDLVLVDLRMPDVDGLEVLSRVKEDWPQLPIIVISGTGEIADVVEALRLGAWDYLLKPIGDMSILVHSVESCLDKARLIEENKRYNSDLEELVSLKTAEFRHLNRRLREVVESTRRLLGCGQLEKSGELLLQEFSRHMEAEGGSLYEVIPQGLHLVACLDRKPSMELLSFPLEEGSIFSKVLDEKEPLFLSDSQDNQQFILRGGTQYRDNSLLVFPLVDADSNVLAVISLHSKKEPPFLQQDYDIGKILLSYASEAIQIANVSAALKSSEDRLRQAQKMEAIGTLAGGIAHDFNNILAAIIGYTDLSLFSGKCDTVIQRNLEQVKKASSRAKDLVAQILAFSRTEDSEESAVDIGPIVKEALKLLRATIPSSIVINAQIGTGLGKVMSDPTRIYQVLMNLCTNAAHAITRQEGTISVSYRRASDEEIAAVGLNQANGDWVCLLVEDTGQGIAGENIDKIFNPYFTTKEKGEGTGLGLSVVHGVVRSSGGEIRVDSEVGCGTSFKLYFPCVQAEHSGRIDSATMQMRGGSERILIVDDEMTLAEMAGMMLELLGYSVTILSSSSAALQLFQERPDGFDLLITDQTMPDISGMELARLVLQKRPGLPVILYTGYSAAIDAEEARRVGITHFLMKPLSMSVLAGAVRETLDGTSSV